MQTETLLAVIAGAAAANFVVLLLILLQLRSQPQPHPPHRQPRSVRHYGYSAPYAYAIWSWKDDRWELDRGSVPPGVDPGPPPTDPGEYPNQMVKTGCYRAP